MSKGIIEHQGMVEQVTSNWIVVSIMAKSACAHCHLSGSCGLTDSKDKIIEVPNEGGNYQPGEKVTVWFKESLGFKALFLGYLLPFILMLTILISVLNYTGHEGLAALSGIGILVPYYFIIYLQRDKLRKTFHFHIQKLQEHRNSFAKINL